MPYRCQKCMNTFKTLTLYNKHATGPSGACNVEKIEITKPPAATTTSASHQVTIKTSVQAGGVKRENIDRGVRVEKKARIYQEIVLDDEEKEAKILADALGDDSDQDPDYNPKKDESNYEDNNLILKQRRVDTSVVKQPNKLYSRVIVPKEIFSCSKCSAKFDTKLKLEDHFGDVHERSCEVCEDDFCWPDESHECYFTKYKLRMIGGDIMPAY